MKKIKFLILIIVALSGIPVAYGETASIDCSYYYIMTLKTIEIYLTDQSKALELATTLINVTLPQNIEKYHKKYYNDIIMLIQATSNYSKGIIAPQQALEILSNIYIKLPKDYIKYSQRLAQCVHDPQVAALTGAETRILIKYKLLPFIEKIIYKIVFSTASNELVVIPDKEDYTPGENATILLLARSKLRLSRLELVEWPTLKLVKDYTLNQTLDQNYTSIRVRLPYAKQLQYVIPSEFASRETVSIALIATFENLGTGKYGFNIRIINVTYKVPKITIQAPRSVYWGEFLNASIVSDGYYPNVTVSINNKVIYNLNLSKGLNKVIINLNKLNITKSIILLQVSVPPGKDYLGIERDKPILFGPPGVPAKIETPSIIYTWLGRVSLRTYKTTGAEVILKVKMGPITIHRESLGNRTITFYASILPITPLWITASTSINGHTISYSKNIIVINPTYIALLSIALLILARPERLEHLILITLSRKAEPLGAIAQYASSKTGKIYSQIAQLYYQTIIFLKARLPYPHETLREHFASLRIPEKVKKPLWRLLRLAEKDLYSKNKPKYSEAEKAFKEVVENARK